MSKKIKRVGAVIATGGISEAARAASKALTPDLPDLPDAPEIAPVADDESLKIANRRKSAKRRSGGRAGTILTEGSNLG